METIGSGLLVKERMHGWRNRCGKATLPLPSQNRTNPNPSRRRWIGATSHAQKESRRSTKSKRRLLECTIGRGQLP